MSEMGEIWTGIKAMRQEKRAANRQSSADLLLQAGIPFQSRNAGAHLIVRPKTGYLIDFWPGTGLWQQRGNPRKHRGVQSLIKHCNKGETA
jgi:hypothetical protein